MKWSVRFMNMAKSVSTWSKDPSKKIGVVIINQENKIISTGYNGFPKNIADTEARLNDKEFKRAITLHAEENAILCAKQDLTNCIMYIYGLPPCAHCAAMIIQSGIKAVYYTVPEEYQISEHWKDNLNIAQSILKEEGVIYTNLNL